MKQNRWIRVQFLHPSGLVFLENVEGVLIPRTGKKLGWYPIAIFPYIPYPRNVPDSSLVGAQEWWCKSISLRSDKVCGQSPRLGWPVQFATWMQLVAMEKSWKISLEMLCKRGLFHQHKCYTLHNEALHVRLGWRWWFGPFGWASWW